MDPKFYGRLWDETHEAWRSAKLYRSLANKHPMVAKWLADDARGSDPAVNPLHFLHRPRFRNPTRQRRLRIFNTLLWALKGEGFALALARDRDDTSITVGHGWHRTTFAISAEEVSPMRATSPLRKKLTGRMSCVIEARLPAGIESRWADEPGAALEKRIPNTLASIAVWAAQQDHRESSPNQARATTSPLRVWHNK
jgi:hypothetical protein